MKTKTGVLPSSPRHREDHPGIKSWSPPYGVPHATTPYSLIPQNIQGIPRRLFSRGGARPALTPINAPPANFAFLLEAVRKTANTGVPVKELVAQHMPPIGIVH